jgi:hypothetical protein
MLACRGVVQKATGCLLNNSVSAVLRHPERVQPHQMVISVELEHLILFRARSLQCLVDRVAHGIACFYRISMGFPPHLAEFLFPSLVDVLPVAPLAVSLVSLACRRLSRRAARRVACFPHWSTSCPLCCSLHRLLLSLVDISPAAPLAG